MTDGRPPIDPDTLADLITDTGRDVLPELVRIFLDTAHARTGRMRAALAEGEPAKVAAEAHALKSSAATFGALALRRLCAELEEASKAGRVADAGPMMADLEVALAAAKQALESYLDGSGAKGGV